MMALSSANSHHDPCTSTKLPIVSTATTPTNLTEPRRLSENRIGAIATNNRPKFKIGLQ